MSSNKPLGSVPDKNRRQPSYIPRNKSAQVSEKKSKKNYAVLVFLIIIIIVGAVVAFQVYNAEAGKLIRTIIPMHVSGVIETHTVSAQAENALAVFLVDSPTPEISATIAKGVELFNMLSTGAARSDETPLDYNENMTWNDLVASFPPKVTTIISKSVSGGVTKVQFTFHKGEFRSNIGSNSHVEMSQTLWRRFRDELDDADPRNLSQVINDFQAWVAKESETLGTYYSRDQTVDDRNMARKAADREFINDVRIFLPKLEIAANSIKQSSGMGISRSEVLDKWNAFSKNELPRIQGWIKRNEVASTKASEDGYFEIEGKGLLVIAVPIGKNLVYFSEASIPTTISLVEYKNSF